MFLCKVWPLLLTPSFFFRDGYRLLVHQTHSRRSGSTSIRVVCCLLGESDAPRGCQKLGSRVERRVGRGCVVLVVVCTGLLPLPGARVANSNGDGHQEVPAKDAIINHTGAQRKDDHSPHHVSWRCVCVFCCSEQRTSGVHTRAKVWWHHRSHTTAISGRSNAIHLSPSTATQRDTSWALGTRTRRRQVGACSVSRS